MKLYSDPDGVFCFFSFLQAFSILFFPPYKGFLKENYFLVCCLL